MKNMQVARLLAYVTGMVNQQLLLQNEYLAAENRILRAHLPTRLRLTDPQRSTLAEISKRLGCGALQQVACAAKPDTILAWYRKLIAQKFDGVGQEQDTFLASRFPEPPDNLKRRIGLARSCGHHEQDAIAALRDGFGGRVDR